MKTFKQFITNFTIGISLVAAIFIPYYFISLQVGEINISQIIEKQIYAKSGTTILFSSGINQTDFDYKALLMKKTKPDVIVVGSSRSMQIRDLYFDAQFTNLGGALQGVTDLEKFASFISTISKKPKLSLILIDPWWFNPKFINDGGNDRVFPNTVNVSHLIKSVNLFQHGNWLKKSFSNDNLGIQAILTGQGFSKDGSYHYTSLITSKSSKDSQFKNTLNMVENGDRPFLFGSIPNQALIQRACSAINLIRNNTSSLILISPPFSPAVWNKINTNDNFSYIEKSYKILQKCLNQKIYNYHNPNILKPSSECEFIDGFHGGDTLYGRLLINLSSKEESVKNYLNMEKLAAFVDDNNGNAGGVTKILFPGIQENDFLGLGCNK